MKRNIYLTVIKWTLITIQVTECIKDTCPSTGIIPPTRVAKMCQATTVFENDKDGNDNFDSVFFSLTEQDNNCYCNVSIKNIETSVDLIINRLNNLTGNSLCGMEIDILQVRSQQEIFLLKQIPTRCDSKENTIRLSLFYDEYLRFTSRVVDGEFSVGYCIQIIRVHNQANDDSFLEISCGGPTVTTPQDTFTQPLSTLNDVTTSVHITSIVSSTTTETSPVHDKTDSVSLSSVPDPCPDMEPTTQVTDMCQAGSAKEDFSESNAGNVKYDHVALRVRKQEDNCTCRVFIEEQSLDYFQIYIQPYENLQTSAPKELGCGLELYLDFYNNETLQQITDPMKCTSGQTGRSFPLKRNSELRFTSKVISGNFTRGYCIDIQRVHVNGQNGTLKIVCGVPGIIPSTQYITPQSLDLSTKSSDHSTSMTHFDDSTVYIASGVSAGVVVIAATAIAIIFCKRHQFQSKEPVPIDNVNMQYDSLSETRNDSNYSTLNSALADDQQHQFQSKEPVPIDNVNMQYDSLSETRNDSNYSTLNSAQADDQQYELVETQK